MKVVFYNRDFTSQVPLSHLKITVERYSHTMNGGPDTAFVKVETSGDNWELTKLLRAPVEIYDGDGHLNWWGYVNRVTVPNGEIMVGLGLDNMYNYVAANYSLLDSGETSSSSQVKTSWVSEPASILEYGQKEKLLTINNATAAQAQGARDAYLDGHKYAPPEVELSGGNTKFLRIECYGWFKTLDWKYYANATTSNISTTAQMSAITTNAGQFLRGALIENASGINSNQYRDGTQTALSQILELTNAGTTNIKPLLTNVDKDRYLHVYERVAENPEYLMRNDGQLETLLGQIVKPSYCICSKWVRVKDIPDTLGGLSAMRNFFIQSAEYDAEKNVTTYRPAGAFEPQRLPRWFGIDRESSGGSGGGGGSISSWTPYHTHPTVASGVKNAVRNDMDNTSCSSGVFVKLSFANPGYTADTIGMTWGSDYFKVPVTGNYLISAQIWAQEPFNPTSMTASIEIYDTTYPGANDNNIYFYSTNVYDGSGNYSQDQTYILSGILYCLAGDECYIEVKFTYAGGTPVNAEIRNFSILQL